MAKRTLESAMNRLEEIVEILDKGEISLEESLKAFEEGMELSKYCAGKLTEAENKLKILVKKDDGYQLELVP
jgi:exodeoxyribonuclease VII small subunit